MCLNIKILSKSQEDCFLIEIGKYTILVDGNRVIRDEVINCLKNIKSIDFLVITHIDNDHIGGIIQLYKSNMKNKFKDTIIIYNKFTSGIITYSQAEEIEKIFEGKNIINTYSSYQNGKEGFSILSLDQRKKLQKKKGDIYITLLHPQKKGVMSVYQNYKKKQHNSKLINRNSISFLLEKDEISILFTGDGYIKDIIEKMKDLLDFKKSAEPVMKINLIKIPHHGSKENNEKLPELAKIGKCKLFISTSNENWDKKHPDENLMEKLCLIDGMKIYTETKFKNNFDNYVDKSKTIGGFL